MLITVTVASLHLSDGAGMDRRSLECGARGNFANVFRVHISVSGLVLPESKRGRLLSLAETWLDVIIFSLDRIPLGGFAR